jgi:hypothetical protein
MNALATTLESAPPLTPLPAVFAPTRTGKTWLFGPWLDLFLVGCAFWPAVVLAALWGNEQTATTLTFFQIYLLTTPHRWITLALVFLDPNKFGQRPRMFVGMAVASVVLCVTYRLGTGTIALLMAVDYVWNAWHFAAQHSGIHRIYGRMARPDVTTGAMLEKTAMRIFLLYVIFRVAGVALPEDRQDYLSWLSHVMPRLQTLDFLMLLLPAGLLAREFFDYRPSARGRIGYLLCLFGAYVGTLLAVHFDQQRLILSFALAIAVFHATEYLAIVSWSVQRQRNPSGVLARLAPVWGVALLIYVGALAVGGLLMTHYLFDIWVLMNLIISLLHYGYDGMIWKQPRPAASLASALPTVY